MCILLESFLQSISLFLLFKLPYSGKRWWEKTLVNSADWSTITKVFSLKKSYPYLSNPMESMNSPKFCTPSNLKSWICQCFLLPTFSAIQYLLIYCMCISTMLYRNKKHECHYWSCNFAKVKNSVYYRISDLGRN